MIGATDTQSEDQALVQEGVPQARPVPAAPRLSNKVPATDLYPVIHLPNPCLVMIIGLSGSGKTTLARNNFAPAEILSSDDFREQLCNDAANQAVTGPAFNQLFAALWYRMANQVTTVADAVNLVAPHRERVLGIARHHGVPAVAVIVDVDVEACKKRITRRRRQVPDSVLDDQVRTWSQAIAEIHEEDFVAVHALTEDQLDGAVFRHALPPRDDPARWVQVDQIEPTPGGIFRLPLDELRRLPHYFDRLEHGDRAVVHAAAERAFTLGNGVPEDFIAPYGEQARAYIDAGNFTMSIGALLRIRVPNERDAYLRCLPTGWAETDTIGRDLDPELDEEFGDDPEDEDWGDFDDDPLERQHRLAVIHGAVPAMLRRLTAGSSRDLHP